MKKLSQGQQSSLLTHIQKYAKRKTIHYKGLFRETEDPLKDPVNDLIAITRPQDT